MCPNHPVGEVDLFVVSRHGRRGANARALLHAIGPRVGTTDSGTRRRGQPEAMRIPRPAPGLEDP